MNAEHHYHPPLCPRCARIWIRSDLTGNCAYCGSERRPPADEVASSKSVLSRAERLGACALCSAPLQPDDIDGICATCQRDRRQDATDAITHDLTDLMP